MKMKNIWLTLILSAAVISLVSFAPFKSAKADTKSFTIGAKIDNFSLADVNGKTRSFNDLNGKKGVVLIFLSAQCPVVKAYTERINQLAKDYTAKGINIVGVNANSTENAEAFQKMATERGHGFPILMDKGNIIADKLGANYTPEAYFFNAKGELLYHGRIDNDRNGTNITENNLRDALEATLSGKEIAKTEAKGFGCSIKRAGN